MGWGERCRPTTQGATFGIAHISELPLSAVVSFSVPHKKHNNIARAKAFGIMERIWVAAQTKGKPSTNKSRPCLRLRRSDGDQCWYGWQPMYNLWQWGICGHRTTPLSFNGNFLKEVRLLAQFDPVMKDHIHKVESQASHFSYLSKHIQNELIECISGKIVSTMAQ